MNIRQAKKIIYSRHWFEYCENVRPLYYDEDRGCWIYPSWHDIPNHTFQRARRKYFGAANRFFKRHGYCFDDKNKGLIMNICDNCNRKGTRYCGMCKHNDDAYYEQAIFDYYEKEDTK